MKRVVKSFFKGAAIFCLSAFVLASCDPEKGKEDVTPVEPDEPEVPADPVNPLADSLENALQKQVRAMYQIATEETILLSNAGPSKHEGLYDMSFETGASCKVYVPALEGAKKFTFAENGGVKYWAVYAEGTPVPVKSEGGDMLEADAEPVVKLVKDEYCLVANNEVFHTGYMAEDNVQAFDCSLKADNAGAIYAVNFDFGSEGRTVYVSSYDAAKFYLAADEAKEAIKELCINWGATSAVGLYIPEGVECKIVASEGWTAEFKKETSTVEITAPVEAENAQSQGTVSVVSEDDLFTFAKLNVTTDVFKTLLASAVKAVVTPALGVDKFAYGITAKADYKASEIVAKATEWIEGAQPAAGAAVSEVAVAVPFAQVLGSELQDGVEYVLWAVANGSVMSVEFSKMAFDLQVVKPYLLDAQVKVAVNGAEAVFGGMVEKTDDAMNDIVFQLENSIQDSIPAANRNFVFEGLLSDYPAVDNYVYEMEPAKTYIMWAAAAVTGEYEYTADDVFFTEVTTNSITDGGSIAAALTGVTTSKTSISAKVTANDAALVYYAVLNNTDGKRYATAANADKYSKIMSSSPLVLKGGNGEIKGEKLNPNTDYWLFAVAVDAEGKYGEVACVTGKTGALTFDTSITLKSEKVDATAKKAVIKVTSTGGDLSDYIYWFGRITDPFWANTTHCGQNKTQGEKYMALYPDDENIVKCMSKYGALGADGTITFDGLTMETDYIFMILEKGETNYSKTGYLKVTTLAADLGVIVREGTDTWNNAKASIKLDWIQSAFKPAASSQMMANYAFGFSCPKNLTAYVMCASDTYFKDAGFTKVEHVMIEIENYASRRYANSRTPIVNGVHATEPDYYKDGELREGQLMNVYEFCIHGVPGLGFVTYFAENSHGEGNCIYWENECTKYQEALASIANYNSLAPWLLKAEQFGLKGAEADAWAKDLLEAYSVYYKDAKPVVYVNDGSSLVVNSPYATGKNEDGIIPDRVVVMLKDLDGNYYEPMYFEVPDYFEE